MLRSETPHLAQIGAIAFLLYGVVVLSLIYLRARHRQIKGLEKLNEELDGRVFERTAELRKNEARLRRFYESGLLGVLYWNMNGEITDANDKFLEMVGYTREDLTAGRIDWLRMTPSEYRQRDEESVTELKTTGFNKIPFEKEYIRKDGTRLPIILAGAMLDEARFNGVAFILDITERKRIEESLRRSEEKFFALFSSMVEGVALHEVVYDGSGKPVDYVITEVNPAFESITGLSRDKTIGKKASEVYGTNHAPYLDVYEKVASSGKPTSFETYFDPMGKHFSKFVISPAKGGFATVFTDITERKQAEEALQQRTLELQHLTETLEERVKERTAELADLSSRLVSAQENERRRVSYDLHDNVWQTLLAIRSEIERLFSGEDGMDREALQDKSKQVMASILETIVKIRSMQGDLWPYVLDDIGLLATLDWYCREFEKTNPGMTIERQDGVAESEVPSSAKIVIYRILQETLSNVAKHSRATRVTLRLMKKDQRVEFAVEDNGIGFDPEETIVRKGSWGGLGLLSIKARTELSGGSFFSRISER